MYAAARLSLSFMTKRERATYSFLIACRALAAFFDVFGILLIGFIASVAAQQLQPPGQQGKPSVVLGFEIPYFDTTGLFWLVVFVLAVFIFKAALAIFLVRTLSHFIATVEARNARDIANYLLRGTLENAKKYSKAEFQYAITMSSNWAFTGILNNVANIISETFLLSIVSIAFIVFNPIVALFAFAYFALVMGLMSYFIGRSLKRAGEDAARGNIDASNAVSDTIDTFREISVLAKQDLFVDRINTSRLRLARSGATLAFLGGMPRYIIETALILGVVILVGQQLITGQLAQGLATLGVFLTGGVRIMASLLPLQTALAALRVNAEQSALAHRLLEEVRASRGEKVAREPGVEVDQKKGLAIVVKSAKYRFPGDDHDTIRGIGLKIAAGEYVAIIGPSGAGKSTLVDLVLGLVTPTSGSVTIGGIEPNVLRALAPGVVSYVPQKPGLVSGSIAENIALGVKPDEIDYELVRSSVESAYLTDFIDSLPEGLATSVGKQVDSLSGGQIQRIGLARALSAQPRLLILDEATSGLDAGSEAFIGKSISKLHGAVTVIVIAHRLSTVQHADNVHVVENGKVTASGDFKTVKATVPMVAEYVKLMSFTDK
jgi:ATP-binding cassette subfamily C protein